MLALLGRPLFDTNGHCSALNCVKCCLMLFFWGGGGEILLNSPSESDFFSLSLSLNCLFLHIICFGSVTLRQRSLFAMFIKFDILAFSSLRPPQCGLQFYNINIK